MTEYNGHERRRYIEPIHQWRWRAMLVWIVVFTFAVFWSIRSLEQDKASIGSLQRTDCALRQFLVAARDARQAAAKHEKGRLKAVDLRAAAGYDRLANVFPSCKDAPRAKKPRSVHTFSRGGRTDRASRENTPQRGQPPAPVLVL